MTDTADDAVLDHPAWASLTNAHTGLAETLGLARRYREDVSPFVALPPDPPAQAWTDLAELAGAGATVLLAGLEAAPPAGWAVLARVPGVQYVATAAVAGWPDPDAVPLGAEDAAEMLALAARTEPGPFRENTYLFGNYWGIRHEGELVAMAGQRLHPPGWAELSAVCTDDRFRGQGLASRLVGTVVAGVRAGGDEAFLHASAANTGAIRLYETLGFRLRRHTTFSAFQVPGR